MEILLLVITLFPAVAALILKGKFFVLSTVLATINIVSVVIAHRIIPNSSPQYLIFSTANIIFACVTWYLAFQAKTGLSAAGNTALPRKLLSTAGWLIVLTTLISIAAIVGFTWYVLVSLPRVNGQ